MLQAQLLRKALRNVLAKLFTKLCRSGTTQQKQLYCPAYDSRYLPIAIKTGITETRIIIIDVIMIIIQQFIVLNIPGSK